MSAQHESLRGSSPTPRRSAAGINAAAILESLYNDKARRGERSNGDDEAVGELEKLARADNGGDALETVIKHLAAQHHVAADVIESRHQISTADRVGLCTSEFRGVQNLLTQRLRRTLAAQDSARRNAYHFRTKATQHLEFAAADNWNAQRALNLLNAESLKIKTDYDHALAQYVERMPMLMHHAPCPCPRRVQVCPDGHARMHMSVPMPRCPYSMLAVPLRFRYVHDMATRQEEARNAEERSAARLRIRATFASAQASVKLLKKARDNIADRKAGRRGSFQGRPAGKR